MNPDIPLISSDTIVQHDPSEVEPPASEPERFPGTSAALCRANGWGPGDMLEGEQDGTWARIVVTAIGDQNVLAREVAWSNGHAEWRELVRNERTWTLCFRDWRKVEPESDPAASGSAAGEPVPAVASEALDAALAASPSGLSGAFLDVARFMRTVDQRIPNLPCIPDEATRRLRVVLVKEELNELLAAVATLDLAGIADGILDSIYVLLGMGLAFGLDLPAMWDAVHRANMQKTTGPVLANGKRGKPPGFVPPDVAGIINRQRPLDEIYPIAGEDCHR